MYSLEIFCFEISVCFVLFIILYYIIENSKITEINSNFVGFYAMRKKADIFQTVEREAQEWNVGILCIFPAMNYEWRGGLSS